MIIAKCETCKKEFKTWECRTNRGAGRFCSRNCLIEYKHTEEWHNMASMARRGELNPAWKGESIKINSGRDRARRLYGKGDCVICDKPGEIHHKDGNPINNAPQNIVFLCKFHHSLVEGRLVLGVSRMAEKTRKRWQDYYKEVPKEEIIKDYKSGIGPSDLAKKYNHDRHVISNWLKKWGVKENPNI